MRVLAGDWSRAIQLVMSVRVPKRVVEIDMGYYSNCGGKLKIIAAILEALVIEKILTHLGLQARATPRAPARGQSLRAA